MNVYEMEGFLRGKCLPGDLLVGESHAEYLVRKLNEATAAKDERDALADKCVRLEYINEQTLQVKLQMNDTIKKQFDRVNALAVENAALKDAITTHSQSTHFCEVCGKDDPCNTDDVCYAPNETPATDAALAAIREQACKVLIDAFVMQVDAAGLDDSDSVTIFECRDTMKYAAEQAINPREAK